jgi:Tfp pilus assembly PilM family ATPase
MNLTVLRNGQQLYVREQAFGGNQLTQDIARLFGMSFRGGGNREAPQQPAGKIRNRTVAAIS